MGHFVTFILRMFMQAITRTSLLLGITTLVSATLLSSPANAGWERTWIEKFDGTGVNFDNWTAQTQANYNNEIQCYTDDETSANRNYEVSNGTLKITAREQNIACPGLNGLNKSWTSGRLNSKDKAEFLYGRIETRLKFNELRNGTWPAFWMLEGRISEQPYKGDNDVVNWPNIGAGEIDVWEWHGNSGDSYITAFHNVNRDQCGGIVRYNYPGGAPDVLSFNTYAIEWSADEIKMYANDNLVVEYDMTNCAQYEEPMFVLLNVAIGGTLGGAVDPTLTNATMEVDYVARCAASDANQLLGCNESTPVAIDTDNDGVADLDDQCPATDINESVDFRGCKIVAPIQYPDAPTQGAPEPNANPDDVIALFSDSYNVIDTIDYDPNWGQTTQVTQVDIEGNQVLKYTSLNYQGTDYELNKQDVSDYNFLHIDYWSGDAQSLALYLISPGPQETPYTFDVTLGEWQSHAIPLSTFAGVVDLTDTFQLKITGNGTVYIDNVYFSRSASGNGTPTQAVNGVPVITSMTAAQNSNTITTINPDDGTVTVSVVASDPDQSDTLTYAWRSDNVSNLTPSADGLSVSFEPSTINGSVVNLTIVVTDNGSPALSVTDTMVMSVSAASTSSSSTTSSTNTSTSTSNSSVTTTAPSAGSLGLWMLGLLGLGMFTRRAERAK